MNPTRRTILRATVSSAVLSVAAAAGLLRPGSVQASSLARGLSNSLQALRSHSPIPSDAIQLKAPDIAVDGAMVFIDFACALPEVEALMVFVDRNPQPLVAAFQIAPEVVPALQMRIKVSQTAQVWVVARSAGQFYKAAKTVKVTVGGCGSGLN